ncbi:MFS transporter [Sphingomonas colocasiae]|uniref:MFS transporter n=1 Tax=Sphingomonas colocasiae TaxID=1848973 RepID=A0ABS7PRB0_9SPHN|nr:MFS transporter [Sphingomonas colocasiae]MBY8823882.1 MFS transporter [Sphingomonas colocasiae]
MAIPIDQTVEGLPVTAFHIRLLALVGVIILLDGFDVQVAAFAGPAILAEWRTTPAMLAPAMAAALVGMAIGTGLGGMAGDRLGRRPALIGSVIVFGALSILTAFAPDITELAILRFLTGIGLGAAVPNATALVAEWMPARIRGYAVTAIIVAVPCGGMIGAGFASWLIPAHGWRLCMGLGGLLPLLLALVMWRSLPESPAILARRSGGVPALAVLLGRAGARVPADAVFVEVEPVGKGNGAGVYVGALRRSGIGLAIAFFASMLALYAYLSWIPVLLAGAGFPMDRAIQGSLVFNLCGVLASFVAAWATPRWGSRTTLIAACVAALLATGVCAVMMAGGRAPPAAILAALGAAGAGAFAVQVTLYSLAVHVFPVSCRAAGIGYSASIGRLGAIASAFGAGLLLALPSGGPAYFALIALACLVSALGVAIVDRHAPRRPM